MALRTGATLRAGHVDALDGDLLDLDLGPGVVWRTAEPDRAQRWSVGLRLDTFAHLEHLKRSSQNGVPGESHGRWLPGAGLRIEGLFALSQRIELVASGGVEALFGSTDLVLNREEVGHLSPLYGVADLGVRARF